MNIDNRREGVIGVLGAEHWNGNRCGKHDDAEKFWDNSTNSYEHEVSFSRIGDIAPGD